MTPTLSIRICAGVIAGILLAYAGMSIPLAVAASAGALLAAAIVDRRRITAYAVLPLAASVLIPTLLGFGLGVRHYRVFPDDAVGSLLGDVPRVGVIQGVIEDEPATRRAGYLQWTTFHLATEAVTLEGERRAASGRLFVLAGRDDAETLAYGQRVRLSGRLTATAGPQNPGEPDRRISSMHQRVEGSLTVSETGALDIVDPAAGNPVMAAVLFLKAKMRAALRATVSDDAAGFLDSILLNDREEVAQEVVDDFTRTGTVHVLAISGQHLSLLCAMLGFVLLRILRAPRRAADLVMLGFAVVYCLLTGASSPVLRATIMIAIVIAGRLRARDASTLNSLAVAATAILVWSPGELFGVGFQLSFISILGLELLFSPMREWWKRLLPPMGVRPPLVHRLRLKAAWALGDAVLVSTAATLVTTPLVLYHFHLVVPGTVIANVVIGAPVAVVLGSGMMTLMVAPCSETLATPFAWVASRSTEVLTWLVSKLAAMPGMYAYMPDISAWQVVASYAAIAGMAWAGARARRPLVWIAPLAAAYVLALVPWSHARPAPGAAELAVLSVGRGQATVVRTAEATVLVGCGSGKVVDPGGRQVAPYLWRHGIRGIDAIVLSSCEDEHTNAIAGVLDRFSVGAVYVPKGFASAWQGRKLLARLRERKVPIRWFDGGERIDRFAGVRIEATRTSPVLSAQARPAGAGVGGPGGSDAEPEDGDRATLLRVSAGGSSALVCGKIPEAQLDEILRSRDGERLKADLVVLPNHGSHLAVGVVRRLVERTGAHVAVASTREGASNAETLCAIEDAGVEVAETWDSGCVEAVLDAKGSRAQGFNRADLSERALPWRKRVAAEQARKKAEAAAGTAQAKRPTTPTPRIGALAAAPSTAKAEAAAPARPRAPAPRKAEPVKPAPSAVMAATVSVPAPRARPAPAAATATAQPAGPESKSRSRSLGVDESRSHKATVSTDETRSRSGGTRKEPRATQTGGRAAAPSQRRGPCDE